MNYKKKKESGFIRTYTLPVLLAVALALLIKSSVVSAYTIPSGSMLSTLLVGDQVLVQKFAYDLRIPFTEKSVVKMGEIKRGDIVVFGPPFGGTDYIKRVIGLPGDEIRIEEKRVLVNGKSIPEPYVQHVDPRTQPAVKGPRDYLRTITVPQGKLFVLGDNRDESYDSRFWGFADRDKVRGKALVIHFSVDWQKWKVRWSRLGKSLL